MAKITKATFKSFIKKNKEKLFIQVVSDFDGMTDCVEYIPQKNRVFKLASDMPREEFHEHTLGYAALWLVGHSRDYFKHYEDEYFTGIEVYNCCGTSIIAIKKAA